MDNLNPFQNHKTPNSKNADDNFIFNENGREFSKWVESTVGKGESARYEQLLLFYAVFQKLVLQTRKNQACWERVKCLPNNKIFNLSKMERLAYVYLNVSKTNELAYERVEKTRGM